MSNKRGFTKGIADWMFQRKGYHLGVASQRELAKDIDTTEVEELKSTIENAGKTADMLLAPLLGEQGLFAAPAELLSASIRTGVHTEHLYQALDPYLTACDVIGVKFATPHDREDTWIGRHNQVFIVLFADELETDDVLKRFKHYYRFGNNFKHLGYGFFGWPNSVMVRAIVVYFKSENYDNNYDILTDYSEEYQTPGFTGTTVYFQAGVVDARRGLVKTVDNWFETPGEKPWEEEAEIFSSFDFFRTDLEFVMKQAKQ